MKFASTIPWQIRIETARFEARQREQSRALRYQLDRFAANFRDATLDFLAGRTPHYDVIGAHAACAHIPDVTP